MQITIDPTLIKTLASDSNTSEKNIEHKFNVLFNNQTNPLIMLSLQNVLNKIPNDLPETVQKKVSVKSDSDFVIPEEYLDKLGKIAAYFLFIATVNNGKSECKWIEDTNITSIIIMSYLKIQGKISFKRTFFNKKYIVINDLENFEETFDYIINLSVNDDFKGWLEYKLDTQSTIPLPPDSW